MAISNHGKNRAIAILVHGDRRKEKLGSLAQSITRHVIEPGETLYIDPEEESAICRYMVFPEEMEETFTKNKEQFEKYFSTNWGSPAQKAEWRLNNGT